MQQYFGNYIIRQHIVPSKPHHYVGERAHRGRILKYGGKRYFTVMMTIGQPREISQIDS